MDTNSDIMCRLMSLPMIEMVLQFAAPDALARGSCLHVLHAAEYLHSHSQQMCDPFFAGSPRSSDIPLCQWVVSSRYEASTAERVALRTAQHLPQELQLPLL